MYLCSSCKISQKNYFFSLGTEKQSKNGLNLVTNAEIKFHVNGHTRHCVSCIFLPNAQKLPTKIIFPECTLFAVFRRSVRVAERLAFPTSDHGVAGSNPAGGEILPEPKRRFIAQSLSYSPFHRLEMTEILLKGRKTLIHPSIAVFRLAA